MSKQWTTVKLGEVLSHRKEVITIDDVTNYKRPRVQLHVKGIVLRDEVPGALIKTKKQQVCRAGEFLVAEIDAKVGGFGIVPESLEGSIVSSHYFLFVIDESKLNRRFLDFFIRTPAFREQVEAQGSTNYAAIRPAHVLGYEIPLPPLVEQRRVVTRIEELAAQIHEARTLRHQAAEETEALLEKLLSTAFKRYSSKFLDVQKLGDLTQIRGGGTPSKHNPTFWNGKIPWVSPKDMKVSDIVDAQDHISEHAVRGSSTSLIPSNSVLVVVRSGILKRTIPVAINRVPVTTNQDMKSLIPSEGLSPEFLRWWFKGNEKTLLQFVKGGTTVQSLVWREVTNMEVSVPPLAEQRRIVAELDALQAEVDALKHLQAETAIELDALLPAILDRAFKGEL